MRQYFKATFLAVLLTISFTGCGDDNTTAKEIEVKENGLSKLKEMEPKKIVQEVSKEDKNLAKKAENSILDVFKDTAKIAPDGKYIVTIFGTNTCPYCMKMKEDIFKSKELQNRLKNDFSSYYLKTHENLRHKLFHEGELMDVDTKTMISIYGVEGTPTIILGDKNGKAVIVVPGYMPTKQFLVTLDFMESKKWEGKDRKNGEVYQALKNYYIEKGIIKG